MVQTQVQTQAQIQAKEQHRGGQDLRPQGRVTIVMATFNGAAFLKDQLNSLIDQTHGAWDLVVSDDGSQDTTRDILDDFAQAAGPAGHKVTCLAGPQQGFCANFLHALCATPGTEDFVAFSDQDDVWLPGRLDRGIAALAALDSDKPALYCSRTLVSDADLGQLRLSALPRRQPSFGNALIQNIASGNTILLNRAAADLARATAPLAAKTPGLFAHDWWLYQLITGCGGQVVFDQAPTLIYRQHGHNQVGANDCWKSRLRLMAMSLRGQFRQWNSANIDALQRCGPHLSPENRRKLDGFYTLRKAWLYPRCRSFFELGFYRQTWPGQAAVWCALIAGRV